MACIAIAMPVCAHLRNTSVRPSLDRHLVQAAVTERVSQFGSVTAATRKQQPLHSRSGSNAFRI